MEWQEITFQIAVTIALTTLVKKMTEEKLGHWYMLISIGFGFLVVFLAMAENFIPLEFVKQSLIVGLSASGVYNIANKIGTGH